MAIASRPDTGDESSSARALFALRLTELWAAAGNPTLQKVASSIDQRMKGANAAGRGQNTSVQRISDWRSGRATPARFASFEPVLVTLIAFAAQNSAPVRGELFQRTAWQRLWLAASQSEAEHTHTDGHGHAVEHRGRHRIRTALRRDLSTFIGRETEVGTILEAARSNPILAIHAIDGMAGVGKTALVTRVAHQLSDRFPDGQFFVELDAHTGQAPAQPADVLARLLVDLGIDPGQVPDTLEGRRSLWRDRLVDQRVLLVLDDAIDSAQIEPLLPGGPNCLTLITSRRRLVALDGALPVSLEVLDPDSAASMFRTLAHRDIVDAEGSAVAEIVRLCGYLPLAIVLLAGRLAHHRTWTIQGLLTEFTSAHDRLGELDTGDRAVRAAFDTSYRALSPALRRVFRRCGQHPGPDFDAYAAAALAGVSLAAARRALDDLYTHHLIDEIAVGRYRFHDLVREYAQVLAAEDPAEERTCASTRLFDYYAHTARLAARPAGTPAARPDAPAITSPAFPTFASALDWIQRERPNLRSCLEYAAAHQLLPHVVAMTNSLAAELRLSGNSTITVALQHRAVAASGDRADRIYAIRDFGASWHIADDYHAAAELLEKVIAAHPPFADPAVEAAALRTLARARYLASQFALAVETLRRAYSLYRAAGLRSEEAAVLGTLGWALQFTGEFAAAVDLLQQALTMHRELGSRAGEASVLSKLGWAMYLADDYPGAIATLDQAIDVCQQIGDRIAEAAALGILGWVCGLEKGVAAGEQVIRRMVACYRDLGIRSGEAFSLNYLGIATYELGDVTAAIDVAREARDIYRDIGNLPGEASALNNLGGMYIAAGDSAAATDCLQDALVIFRAVGHRVGEAQSLELLAAVRAGSGGLPITLHDHRSGEN